MKIQNPILAHEYSGLEFDWIGVDDIGEIGYFCTGGQGQVPPQAIESALYIDEAADLILGLPKESDITVIDPLKEWEEIGQRGIYVFDWSRQLLEYKAVVIPSQPLNVSDRVIFRVLQKINPAKIEGRLNPKY